jgi:hypothetical protein
MLEPRAFSSYNYRSLLSVECIKVGPATESAAADPENYCNDERMRAGEPARMHA